MKIHWKGTNFASSVARNSLLQLIMWVAFFPGFYSADSFAAVEMARTGQLTNSYTAIWALYVRIFSFHGHAIGLLTLINSLILVYAITTFTFSIFSCKTAAFTSFIITLTPTVWAIGITLWHDILMTAGLLLVVSFFTQYHKTGTYSRRQLTYNLIFGSVLTAFRPNGLPTLVIFSVFLYLIEHKKQLLKLVSIAITISGLVTFVTSQFILGLSPINNYYAQEWMRSDISCYSSTSVGKGFVEKYLADVGNKDRWASRSACTFLNTSKLNSSEKIDSEKYVPAAWLKLLQADPLFVISTHSKRNAYLLPVPINGLPKTPFLHSTIEFKNQGIKWKFPNLVEKLRVPIRGWNALRNVTAWAGLWVLIILTIHFRSRKLDLSSTLVMSIALLLILFIFAPIPDGRYALFALLTGQTLVIGSIQKIFLEFKETYQRFF